VHGTSHSIAHRVVFATRSSALRSFFLKKRSRAYTFEMYYVYILRDLSTSRTYVGFSENLRARLSAHQAKSVKTTQGYFAPQLEFYAAFRNKTRALAFEKYLKRGSGFAFAKKHLC